MSSDPVTAASSAALPRPMKVAGSERPAHQFAFDRVGTGRFGEQGQLDERTLLFLPIVVEDGNQKSMLLSDFEIGDGGRQSPPLPPAVGHETTLRLFNTSIRYRTGAETASSFTKLASISDAQRTKSTQEQDYRYLPSPGRSSSRCSAMIADSRTAITTRPLVGQMNRQASAGTAQKRWPVSTSTRANASVDRSATAAAGTSKPDAVVDSSIKWPTRHPGMTR